MGRYVATIFPESQNEENRLSKKNLRLKSAVEEHSIFIELAIVIAHTQCFYQITKIILTKFLKYHKIEQGFIQIVLEKIWLIFYDGRIYVRV